MIFELKSLFVLLVVLFTGTTLYRQALSVQGRKTLDQRPVVILLGLTAVAFVSPSIWLLYAAAFLVVPIFARTRADVAPFYFVAAAALPGLATSVRIGGAYLTSVSVPMFIQLGALTALMFLPGRAGKPGAGRTAVALLMFVVFLLSGLRGANVTTSLRLALDLALSMVLPFFIIGKSLRDFSDLWRLMLHMSFVATTFSVVAIFEAFKGWPIYRILYSRFPNVDMNDTMLSFKMRGGFLRSPGPYPESTSFALSLMIGLLATWALRRAFGNRVKYFLVLGVGLVGLLPQMSRGAWLGAIFGIIVHEIVQRRFRGIGLVAAAAVALFSVGSPYLERVPIVGGMLAGSSDAAGSTDYRANLLRRGLEEMRKEPLFGDTLGNVVMKLEDMKQGEGIVDFVNTYVYVGLIGGLVGLGAFMFALLAPIGWLYRRKAEWRRLGGWDNPAAFVISAMATIILILAFQSFGGSVQATVLTLIAMAAVASAALARDRGARRRQRRADEAAAAAEPVPA